MTYRDFNSEAALNILERLKNRVGNYFSHAQHHNALSDLYDMLGMASAIRNAFQGRGQTAFGSSTERRFNLHMTALKMLQRAIEQGKILGMVGAESSGSLPRSIPASEKAKLTSYGQWVGFVLFDRGSDVPSNYLTFNPAGMEAPFGPEQEGDAPPAPAERDDIVVTQLSGWAEGFVHIRPAEHLMERVPASLRALAVRAAAAGGNEASYVNYITAAGEFAQVAAASNNYPTGQSILDEARVAYREQIRARLGRGAAYDDSAERAAREAHRAKTKANFEAFVRNREKDADEHILKLPFVPHGLASSRRWGIEVESGGARGVETPANWEGKGDGSLRSAYEGYVEVQDFEPYDEEVRERVHWERCDNANRHNPRQRITVDGESMYVPREDYIDPRECASCGDVTRIVRREPQTIHHTARGGDCREFVSPILTSMHSKGLEQLTEALSKNPQNSSAGVHVHVEANDLSPEQIATMVYGYDILEPILEASYRRERRDFCERRDVSEVLEAARKARKGGVKGNEGGRYRTLNTHSLSAHGTLEFRAMGPVYEYEYLIRWAMLCRELVNTVANGAKTRDFAKIKNWDDLTAFLARFGKEYIRAAVYEMTGEVGEAAKLEKAGQPVTTQALDLDLQNLLAGTYELGESVRRMAEVVTSVRPDASRLVTALATTPEI